MIELLGIARQVRRHVVEDRLLAEVVADDLRDVPVDHLVVGDARADRVRQRDVARADRAEQPRDAEHRLGAERERIEELVVDPAVDDVHLPPPRRGAHVDAVLQHEEVAALDELDPHLLGQEGVLEVGGVVDARRQHHDARPAGGTRDGPTRREADEVVEELPGVGVDRADAELGEPVGERPRHDLPVREHVRDAAGCAQVVLEDHPATVVAPDQIAAGDVDVLVVRNVDADDLPAEVAGQHDEPARHDPVAQDLLPVVDVVEEAVQRLDALSQARLDDRPLVGREDAGNRVERQDPLGALLAFGVDRERHTAVQERPVRELRRAPKRRGRPSTRSAR